MQRFPVWRERQLRDLNDAAAASLRSIASRVESRAIIVNHTTVAWGQYLDDRFTGQQWGLLGTSAASQILALTDPAEDPYAKGGSVAKARAILFEDRARPSALLQPQINRGELGNIVRLASVAEALGLDHSGTVVEADWPQIVRTIVELRHGAAWWSSESASLNGSVTASGSPFVTAFVVHALRRYECNWGFDDARSWLVDHIGDPGVARRIDLIALIGLALLGRESDSRITEIQRGITRCQELIIEKRGRVRSVVVDRPLFVGYAVDGRTDYAFVNPEMLSALFLLRSGHPVAGRSFVLRTVRETTRRVKTGTGFATELGGEATVEQLWAARLLHEFRLRADSSEGRKTLRPRIFLSTASAVLLIAAIIMLSIGLILLVGGDALIGIAGVVVGGFAAIVAIILAERDH